MEQIKGRLVDLDRREIYGAVLTIKDGKVQAIDRDPARDKRGPYLMPGFVDAHVHVESSMLPPAEFAKMAVVHGTVATVSDPHEIANVLGEAGVHYMLEQAAQTPLHIHFGAPSCVPATAFETAGATLDVAAVTRLLERPDIGYLSEMMNFPGVLNGDADVLAKIAAAHRLGKPVDGHAPGLRGEEAARYAAAGIATDHECFTEAEARDKLAAGMKILIREGSAARNFEALIGLLPEFPDRLMFCTDDAHPNDLIARHIDQLVSRAVRGGCDLFDVLQVACRNPVEHYNLPIGQLRVGDPADLILVDDLRSFGVAATYRQGVRIADAGAHRLPTVRAEPINRFAARPVSAADFRIPAKGKRLRAIRVLDGELITETEIVDAVIADGDAIAAPERDLLKIAVVNRYEAAPPALGFVTGFKMQMGAMASTVAHDSHNIVAIGVDDASLAAVVNALIDSQGGIAAGRGDRLEVLPLPIAGLMSDEPGPRVAARYSELSGFARRSLRCSLSAPFMSMSFLALLVIPELKLSDRGLFDGRQFAFVELFA